MMVSKNIVCMKNFKHFKTESKDSKEKEVKDEDTSRSNIFKKFMYALSFMTIEPMMVLQGIASNIVMVPEDQMVLYKICRGISLYNICDSQIQVSNLFVRRA